MNALKKSTKHHVLSALLAAPLLLSSVYASAEDAAAPAAPPYTLTYNLGLYSNYMFRGVDNTGGPALQGGIDWAHSSGIYLGTWFSNLDPYVYGKNDGLQTKGNYLETDFYAGYAHTFENGFGINVLGNYYAYLEGRKANNLLANGSIRQHKQDSFEASIALSYKWFTYTYFNVITDYYGLDQTDSNFVAVGNRGTDGADYHELKANFGLPVGDLNLMAKVGYQRTPGLQGDEGDYAIGLSRNFSMPTSGKPLDGFSAGLTYTGTFAVKNEAYYLSTDGRDTNEDKLAFYIKRSW